MCTTHNMCTIINISLSLAGMQTARFSAAAAFFTAVWVTCVNRVDPMSLLLLLLLLFFFGGGGLGGSKGLIIISSTVILYCIYQISTVNSRL